MNDLLCKVGWHKWIELGKATLMQTDSISQCKHCKVGKCFFSFGMCVIYFTAEEMREAWDSGKIKNHKAYREVYGRSKKEHKITKKV